MGAERLPTLYACGACCPLTCKDLHGKRAATLSLIRRPNGMGAKLHGQGPRV
jgi:hypothetical protein